jgi:hypothetical protein
MDAAIVELDALADAVRAAAEDDDLFLVGRRRLVGGAAETAPRRSNTCRACREANSAAQVSMRLKTGRTPSARRRARLLPRAGEPAEPASEKPMRLSRRSARRVAGRPLARISASSRRCRDRSGTTDRSCRRVDLGVAHAEPHRLRDFEDAVGRRRAERARMAFLSSPSEARDRDLVEAGEAGFERAQRLLHRLSAKVRPIAIASPTDFIEVVSTGSAPGNFSKAKRGILVTT